MRLVSLVLFVAGVLFVVRGITLDPAEYRWLAIWALVSVGGGFLFMAWSLAGLAARQEYERRRRRRPRSSRR